LVVKSQNNNEYNEFLKYIDVIVDGRFVMKLLSTQHKYRGSSNQRLIDVQKTLAQGKVVEINL
jgi:anaerobic ribonucleoside-triphosphate reductase activating protein